jgi:hypothetical protein
MTEVAIRVENLRKHYRIGKRERYHSLRDTLTDGLCTPLRGLLRPVNPQSNSTILALKDVSFERLAIFTAIGKRTKAKNPKSGIGNPK